MTDKPSESEPGAGDRRRRDSDFFNPGLSSSQPRGRRLEKGRACVECKARKKVSDPRICFSRWRLCLILFCVSQRCDARYPACTSCVRQSTECTYGDYDRTPTHKLQEKIQRLEEKLNELEVSAHRAQVSAPGELVFMQ